MRPLDPVTSKQRAAYGFAFFVLFVALWAWATFGGYVSKTFLANPLTMLQEGFELLTKHGFLFDIGMTIWRVLGDPLDLGRADRLMVAATHFNPTSVFGWNVILYPVFYGIVAAEEIARALEKLARADAFRSLGLERRDAFWAIRALQRTGEKDDLPLFARVAMNEPWTLAKKDIAAKLPVALTSMGLSSKETADFMAFWLPKLQAVTTPYVQFNFEGTATHGTDVFIDILTLRFEVACYLQAQHIYPQCTQFVFARRANGDLLDAQDLEWTCHLFKLHNHLVHGE